jgi:hypothetical protein
MARSDRLDHLPLPGLRRAAAPGEKAKVETVSIRRGGDSLGL